jgi:CBS domain-containing protein
MRIKEVMTESPQTCRVGDSANDAARIMWECDCGVVPIVDHAGRVAGIVTDRDICMAAYFQGRPLSQIAVGSIMSPDVSTCSREADLTDAERLMQERQIHRVPVVDDGGHLVGMLSLSDVARGVKRSGALAQKNGEAQELLQTVTRISEPRASQHART